MTAKLGLAALMWPLLLGLACAKEPAPQAQEARPRPVASEPSPSTVARRLGTPVAHRRPISQLLSADAGRVLVTASSENHYRRVHDADKLVHLLFDPLHIPGDYSVELIVRRWDAELQRAAELRYRGFANARQSQPAYSVEVELAVSADGARIAFVTPEPKLVCRDVELGEGWKVELEDDRDVTALALSGDGQLLALGDREGTIELRGEGGEPLQAWEGHARGVRAMTWLAQPPPTLGEIDLSPERSASAATFDEPRAGQLVSAGGDRQVKLWAPDADRPVETLHADEPLDVVALASSGRVFGLGETSIHALDVHEGRASVLTELPYAYESWDALAVAHDGRHLAVSAPDGRLALVTSGGELLAHVLTPEERGTSIAFSADNQHVLRSSGRTIERWSVPALTRVSLRPGHGDTITVLVHRADMLLSAGADGSVWSWPEPGEPEVLVRSARAQLVRSLDLSDDGAHLLVTFQAGPVELWTLAPRELVSRAQPELEEPAFAQFVSDDRVALATTDGHVRLLALDGEQIAEPTPTLAAGLSAFVAAPDRRAVALSGPSRAAEGQHVLALFDPDQPERRRGLSRGSRILALAWSPDGSEIVFASASGSVLRWDGAETLEHVSSISAQPTALAVLHGGEQLVLAVTDGEGAVLQRWALESGELLETIGHHHVGAITTLTSLGPRAWASGGEGGMALVWAAGSDGRKSW